MTSRPHVPTCDAHADAVLIEALRLQRIGLSLIPVGSKKKPAIAKWKPYQSSPADESQVRDWFDKRDDIGLAIILGGVSGNVVVRDFDIRQAWQRWAGDYPKLEQMLPAVETSRGRHVYARISDCPALNYEDGELRAKGQYVLCPPSVHPSGKRYFWLRGFNNLSDVPTLTLEQSGFGRCWFPPDGQHSVTDRTESISVRSVRSVLSVTDPDSDLIDSTLPHAFGTRRHRLFELARRVRVDPQWQDVSIQELRPLVEHWHQLALPFIRTKCFDESWADFIEAFKNVDAARCGDAAAIAMVAADAKELPPEAMRYLSPVNRRLVALCAELGRRSADGVFFLACRKAAAVLGVSNHMAVARSFQMLVADGVLIEVAKGGPTTNKASRYRWTS